MTANIDVDLLIVGGGINGTGIARDVAGRGLERFLTGLNHNGIPVAAVF